MLFCWTTLRRYRHFRCSTIILAARQKVDRHTRIVQIHWYSAATSVTVQLQSTFMRPRQRPGTPVMIPSYKAILQVGGQPVAGKTQRKSYRAEIGRQRVQLLPLGDGNVTLAAHTHTRTWLLEGIDGAAAAATTSHRSRLLTSPGRTGGC
ncbi:hypothetical protein CTAM01_08595 [Colletotrichum tamarilloi]|uniref:Uncharacterized protein n=1 Tax=Colletotrichum tamarilloi TaxID=1209934 RepID=A0ABQ9R5X7_9PEZI|nr:uncharacterized protein CTAM01_08595 [Colletotrichum tamarilloi]KAK1495466.1 hypothetical protein CTAM01_08595 [Colletotrichum tamarilloi]